MSLVYYVLIQPLVVLFDLIFSIIYSMIEFPVVSIIVFSIVINLLVLPLYNKAEFMQKEEQEKSIKMQKWVKHIKKSFNGNERFMMLSTYYRIENYNPLCSLKEAVPLLLQVPFFIAAYKYICSLSFFKGVSFGGIKDLMVPDSLFTFFGLKINVLPILMTIVNLIAGYLYSRNGTFKQKLQIYLTAVVFLILLYNSPAILVIYWLMNNIFSVFKELYKKYKKPDGRLFYSIVSIILIISVVVGIVFSNINTMMDGLVAEIIVVFSVLSIMKSFIVLYLRTQPTDKERKKVEKLKSQIKIVAENKGGTVKHLLLSEICLVILLGFYIPSTILSSSPNEFVGKDNGQFYYDLLYHPFTMYAGIILIWGTIFVLSKNNTYRFFYVGLLWIVLGLAIINQFFFNPEAGMLYSDLTFEDEIHIGTSSYIINIAVCVGAAAVFWAIYAYLPKLMEFMAVSFALGLLVTSVFNVIKINNTLEKTAQYNTDDNCPIKLSKNGRNVVVIMLDRAIGEYVPFIFDEKKELKESYRGFTYYPNTISFGTRTNYGSPGLFGGYEYIPSEMNKRDDMLLVDKHNEALKLMPVLFSENGYNVTVCDPPYAGYVDIPDLSIYNDYPEIKAYNLKGKYSDGYGPNLKRNIHSRQKHNFLIYSLYRSAPLLFKKQIYDNGRYIAQAVNKSSYSQDFLDAYSVLDKLSEITEITDDDNGCFLMLQNDTPHNPTALNAPDYKADNSFVDESKLMIDRQISGKKMKIDTRFMYCHYCVNVASYLEIAEWIDYMKENGVYDNTRIILVSDHGYRLGQFDYLKTPDGLDVESVQPLLMVKDFEAEDEWSTDMTFMTNADVPVLAMEGVINNPINPFTGKLITNKMKNEEPMLITDSANFLVQENNGYKFDAEDGNWWSVHDNIYDMSNWQKVD